MRAFRICLLLSLSFLVLSSYVMGEESAKLKEKFDVISNIDLSSVVGEVICDDSLSKAAWIEKSNDIYQALLNGERSKPYRQVNTLRFSPSGNHFGFFAKTDEGWICCIDGVESVKFDYILPGSLLLFDNGNRFFAGVQDGMYMLDLNSSMYGPYDDVSNIHHSQDGTVILYSGLLKEGGTGDSIPYLNGEAIKHAYSPMGLSVSKSGRYSFYAAAKPGAYEQCVLFVDGKPVNRFKGPCSPVVWSQDGKKYAYYGRAWLLPSQKETTEKDQMFISTPRGVLKGLVNINCVSFLPDGSAIFIAGSNDTKYLYVDNKQKSSYDGNPAYEIAHGNNLFKFAWVKNKGNGVVTISEKNKEKGDYVAVSPPSYNLENKLCFLASKTRGTVHSVIGDKTGKEFRADFFEPLCYDTTGANFVYLISNLDLNTAEFTNYRLVVNGLVQTSGYDCILVSEPSVGEVIVDPTVPRDEIFVESPIAERHMSAFMQGSIFPHRFSIDNGVLSFIAIKDKKIGRVTVKLPK